MAELVTGTFQNADAANDAIDRLISMGYPSDDISVIMSRETHSRFGDHDAPGESQGANVAKGAAGGGMIGGTLGAIVAGTLATTGAVGAAVVTGGAALPFIAGPLAAALAGAGAGAAAGSAIGALVGAGASHEHVKDVQNDVDSGNIVVAVHAEPEEAPEIRSLLKARVYAN